MSWRSNGGAVAKRIANDPALAGNSRWIEENLPLEIKTVLDRHQVRSGYAVLSGVNRPVWVLPAKDIKLSQSKPLKALAVEVVETIYSASPSGSDGGEPSAGLTAS